MQNEYKYIVKGEPIPLLRARYGRRSVYDSQRHIKLAWGIELKNQHDNKEMLEGPLRLDIFFYMQIPQNITKVKQEAFYKRPHIYTPDLSNLIKFVEDCATGIIYRNDCLIACVSAQKLYDPNPRTEFIVTKIAK